jgi:cob(I)alamin adenosyltransferase
MPELNEEHFELHDQNKAERYERQKIKFLEDRITTLEKSIERLNKIVSIWKLGQEENNHE